MQRVKEASLDIEGIERCKIGKGLLVFIGIEADDDSKDYEWLTNKILNLRIFPDQNNQMNLSLLDIQGELLLVSQFTLFASTKKGKRPSFTKAAQPEFALELYKETCNFIQTQFKGKVKTGVFGADMQVKLINDGPVSIWIDSKNRE